MTTLTVFKVNMPEKADVSTWCMCIIKLKRAHYLSSTTDVPRMYIKVPEILGLTHDVCCSILRAYQLLQVLVQKRQGKFLDGDSTHLNNNISSPDPWWVSPSKQNAHTARPEFGTILGLLANV